MTLVVTLPPASRQMRAATLSTANPLLPRTPARAQGARWWPGVEWLATPAVAPSAGEGEDGAEREGFKTGDQTQRTCGQRHSRSDSSLGKHHGFRHIVRQLKRSLYSSSTLDVTSCCHPLRSQLGSNSSGCRGAGLTPRASAAHEGISKPRTPLRDLAATAAACKLGVSGAGRRVVQPHRDGAGEYLQTCGGLTPPKDNGTVAVSDAVCLCWVHLQNQTETPPQTRVVDGRRWVALNGVGNSTVLCTMQQQQPRALHVSDPWNAVQQDTLFVRHCL